MIYIYIITIYTYKSYLIHNIFSTKYGIKEKYAVFVNYGNTNVYIMLLIQH